MGSKIKSIAVLILLSSCAHQSQNNKEELVTVDTALFQARSSYLLGCTEARIELKEKDAFDHCSHKAQRHLQDLEQIMDQNLK